MATTSKTKTTATTTSKTRTKATTIKLRQLIDMSIGSPEPGHVNFYALHCLLCCIADKLNIMDETVDFSLYDQLMSSLSADKISKRYDCIRLYPSTARLSGGQEEEVAEETAPAAAEAGEAAATTEAEGAAAPREGEAAPAASAGAEAATAEEGEQSAVVTLDEAQEPVEVVEEDEGKEEGKEQPIESEAIQDTKTDAGEENPEPTLEEIKSETASAKSELLKISIHDMDVRLNRLENRMNQNQFTDNMAKALFVMKDQIELSISHLLLLTYLTLSKEPDFTNLKHLYYLSKQLKNIHALNVYIESQNLYDLGSFTSLEWRESELQLDAKVSEEGIFEIQNADASKMLLSDSADMKEKAHQERELEGHLCYSPEKLLCQIMEIKSEFCILVNKVNEISARVLKQESQQTVARIQELQEQMREVRLTNMNLKAQQDRMELRITQNTLDIQINKASIEELIADKVDKSEMEILLADKVDYNQLQRKVSLDQMLEMQCRMDKKFCEIIRQISENDKKMLMIVENLKETLGFAAIEGILNTFKEQITAQVHSLEHLIQEYIDATNDECAAAGARVKVLQDLACLSCDTTCVMRSVETKVPKFPSAHASVLLSPLITYELGSIRKSGTMGYYRKDDFPHAPNAWMNRQGGGFNNSKQCVPRHAGGPHTTSTARERVEKVLLNKK